ncbi:fatty-acyl-CoA synthase [Antricoccus suffuscus]|uniref:Fatty-acyl-CoA synthase n=1 Tax=Antricoccus suffuscus TaxID=1629062 RepID=A0A2T1A6U5_9ACTN|nr:acyl-CoA synthetase [Antricoccus suffuscus]PRZ44048.1 fatty-acyl-CoA synthase [Antricoccus suffuscus]
MYPGSFAAQTPDKLAAIMSDNSESLTYAQLEEQSIRLARVLHEHGLRPGDSLAFIAPNSLIYYVAYWAAVRSGLYVTAINNNLSVDEVAYIVNDCGARAFIVHGAYAGKGEKLIPETPKVELRFAAYGPIEGHRNLEDALAGASSEPMEDQPTGREMLYSSGTTGRPKGIKGPLPGYQIGEEPDPLFPVFGVAYGFGTDTVYLSPAPLYHSAPFRFSTMAQSAGGTVVVMPKFDPEGALAAIERYKVTHSQWVPTMFIRMLKLPEQIRTKYDLSTHKVAVHAAAPCPVEVKQQMIEWWGPILEEYYAATESIGATLVGSETWLSRPGTVGQALMGVLHICDDDGNDVPTGQRGVIYFEREEFPFEYHNAPEKTAQAKNPQHPTWGTTGDIGYMDDEGFLYLTDRKAFMIISGGVNIYPQEIENALALHPKVTDLAVIGIPDPEMGEQVKAVVQPADGIEPTPELATELLEFLRERIAHFKVPKSIDFVAELPRTPVGKLVKHQIRAQYLKGETT